MRSCPLAEILRRGWFRRCFCRLAQKPQVSYSIRITVAVLGHVPSSTASQSQRSSSPLHYRMVNSSKEKNPPADVVFPSNFGRLLIEYQEHPEAKSLAPDGTLCKGDTRGLLRRAHIVAGELRYIGKETDPKWEEGDDISVLEFKTTEYGRSKKVVTLGYVKAARDPARIAHAVRNGHISVLTKDRVLYPLRRHLRVAGTQFVMRVIGSGLPMDGELTTNHFPSGPAS